MDVFCNMTGGDSVEVNVRYSRSKEIKIWPGYLWMAGNVYHDYIDSSDAVGRRNVCLEFTTRVTKVKGNLNKLLTLEAHIVAIRVIEKYREVATVHGNDDFWEICHPRLREIRTNAEVTCPIKAYLRNGNKRFEFFHEQGALTNLKDFTALFKGQLPVGSKFVASKAMIEHAILGEGYTIKNIKICHTCSKKYAKDTCGDHYIHSSARDVQMIVGMKTGDTRNDTPHWDENKTYDVGDKVQYNRLTFKARCLTKVLPIANITSTGTWERVYAPHVYGHKYNDGDIVQLTFKNDGMIGLLQSTCDGNDTIPNCYGYPGANWRRYEGDGYHESSPEPPMKKLKYNEEPSIEEESLASLLDL